MSVADRENPDRLHCAEVMFRESDGWTKDSSRSWLKSRDMFVDGYVKGQKTHKWRQYARRPKDYTYMKMVMGATDKWPLVTLVMGHPMRRENKEKDMSLTKKLQQFEGEIKELRGQLETTEAEKAEIAAQLQAKNEELKSLHAEITEERDRVLKAHEGLSAELEESKKAQAAAEKQVEEAQAQLKTAKQALANPAFADASVVGRVDPITDGGDGNGSGDDGDDDNEPEGKAEWEQYKALIHDDPARATALWDEKKDLIKKYQREHPNEG